MSRTRRRGAYRAFKSIILIDTVMEEGLISDPKKKTNDIWGCSGYFLFALPNPLSTLVH